MFQELGLSGDPARRSSAPKAPRPPKTKRPVEAPRSQPVRRSQRHLPGDSTAEHAEQLEQGGVETSAECRDSPAAIACPSLVDAHLQKMEHNGCFEWDARDDTAGHVQEPILCSTRCVARGYRCADGVHRSWCGECVAYLVLGEAFGCIPYSESLTFLANRTSAAASTGKTACWRWAVPAAAS